MEFLKCAKYLDVYFPIYTKFCVHRLDVSHMYTGKNIDSFILRKIIYEILKDFYKDDINLINDNNINEVINIITY